MKRHHLTHNVRGRTAKIVILIVSCTLAILTLPLLVFILSNDFVHFDVQKVINTTQLTILDATGQEVDLTQDYLSQVDITRLQQHTVDAFVCAEDRRFFEHSGLDIKGILRAMGKNLSSGNIVQGGSTITQQVIKNTHLTAEKTFSRKINEAILALQLENQLSKHQILEAYLNKIYFGGACYGISNASKYYFGVSPYQLSLSQSATLAGLLKSPNNYSPLANMEKCIERRDAVLTAMLDENVITDEQYVDAVEDKVQIVGIKQAVYQNYIDAVIAQTARITNMTQSQVMSSGFTIKTYLDVDAQTKLESIIVNDKTTSVNGGQLQKTALLANNREGAVNAFYAVGTYDVLSQRRNIGSTAKPLCAYAPAIEERKLTTMSVILDDETNYFGYTPTSQSRHYGWITAKTALAKSLNNCALNAINSVGLNTAKKYLAKCGISTTEQDSLLISLGCFDNGVSLIELNSAYTALANGGQYTELSFIKSIYDADNNSIYERNAIYTTAFSQQTAFLITDMLREVVTSGTARALRNLPYEVACKTGTVGDKHGNTDAIACAYTSEDTMCVWITSNSDKMSNSLSGSYCADVLSALMNSHYKDEKVSAFVAPQGISQVELDAEQLRVYHKCVLADNSTKNRITAYFSDDTVPLPVRSSISLLLTAHVDKNTITLNCPDAPIGSKLIRLDSEGNRHNLGNYNGKFVDDVSKGGNYAYYIATVINSKEQTISNIVSVVIPNSVISNHHSNNEGTGDIDTGKDIQSPKNDDRTQEDKSILDDILKFW